MGYSRTDCATPRVGSDPLLSRERDGDGPLFLEVTIGSLDLPPLLGQLPDGIEQSFLRKLSAPARNCLRRFLSCYTYLVLDGIRNISSVLYLPGVAALQAKVGYQVPLYPAHPHARCLSHPRQPVVLTPGPARSKGIVKTLT
jgi:hypothetical protein